MILREKKIKGNEGGGYSHELGIHNFTHKYAADQII